MKLEIQGEREILNPSPQDIKTAIQSITLSDDPFLILETDADGLTYVQAILEDNSLWTVEYQDGSVEQHFQACNVDMEKVVNTFVAFAAGDQVWRSSVNWEHITV